MWHRACRLLLYFSRTLSHALLFTLNQNILPVIPNYLMVGIPYLNHDLFFFSPDMLNHSPNANCFLHWRFKDRMLEVMIKAGHAIKKGDEVLSMIYAHLNFFLRKGLSGLCLLWSQMPCLHGFNDIIKAAHAAWLTFC